MRRLCSALAIAVLLAVCVGPATSAAAESQAPVTPDTFGGLTEERALANQCMNPTSLAVTPAAPRAGARDAPAAPPFTLADDTRSVGWLERGYEVRHGSLSTRGCG